MLSNDEPGRHEPDLEAAFAEFAGFQAGFRRNRRGNLCRQFEGQMLSVFRREQNGTYGWSTADLDAKPAFSPDEYDTEEDAMFGLGRALGFPV